MASFDYRYNPELIKKTARANCFVDKKLGFQIIEQGTILPYKPTVNGKYAKRIHWGFGGIADINGEFVKNTHVISDIDLGEAYTPLPGINST